MFKNLFKRQTKTDSFKEISKQIIEIDSPISEGVFVVEHLGMPLYDDSIAPLIEIGATVPTQKSYTFSTTEDGQDQIMIRLCRGKNLDSSSVFHLGQFQVVGIPKLPAREPSIQITFFIDPNQISICAKDLITSKYLDVLRVNDN